MCTGRALKVLYGQKDVSSKLPMCYYWIWFLTNKNEKKKEEKNMVQKWIYMYVISKLGDQTDPAYNRKHGTEWVQRPVHPILNFSFHKLMPAVSWCAHPEFVIQMKCSKTSSKKKKKEIHVGRLTNAAKVIRIWSRAVIDKWLCF